MTQDEFLALWRAHEPAYRAWGLVVRREVEQGLARSNPGINLGSFIKIPAEPRLKEEDSLIAKAFFRGKDYKDPFLEIEDKVGIRFVVLLTSEIDKVQRVIEQCPHWIYSLDRDYEKEQAARPAEFGYQSKHYVVKSVSHFEEDGVVIPIGTPCEIQIRTLLQHAHSELTHGNIYKREEGTEVSKKVARAVAKSMALIEAVDDYFLHAVGALNDATKADREILDQLDFSFQRHVGIAASTNKSGQLVINAYRDHLNDLSKRIDDLVAKRPYIVEMVKSRMGEQMMFRQSWIFLVYLLVDEMPRVASDKWPFPLEEVRAVYVDLGRTV